MLLYKGKVYKGKDLLFSQKKEIKDQNNTELTLQLLYRKYFDYGYDYQ